MQSVEWLCTFAWDVVRSAKGHVMQWCTWCVGAWVVFGCEQHRLWERMLMLLLVSKLLLLMSPSLSEASTAVTALLLRCLRRCCRRRRRRHCVGVSLCAVCTLRESHAIYCLTRLSMPRCLDTYLSLQHHPIIFRTHHEHVFIAKNIRYPHKHRIDVSHQSVDRPCHLGQGPIGCKRPKTRANQRNLSPWAPPSRGSPDCLHCLDT